LLKCKPDELIPFGFEDNKKTSLCIPKVAIEKKGQNNHPKFALKAAIPKKQQDIK
tara:strand:+ start:438 stop:602 length:165 start_codon:yes stop_codon:yes gene_type:complete